MESQATIAKLLLVLEHARERPGMYFSNIDAADSFLRGFRIAANTCIGMNDLVHKFRGQVTIERGWVWSSLPPWGEMKQTGMSEQDVIKEMLTIEIEAWKRVLKQIEQGVP